MNVERSVMLGLMAMRRGRGGDTVVDKRVENKRRGMRVKLCVIVLLFRRMSF